MPLALVVMQFDQVSAQCRVFGLLDFQARQCRGPCLARGADGAAHHAVDAQAFGGGQFTLGAQAFEKQGADHAARHRAEHQAQELLQVMLAVPVRDDDREIGQTFLHESFRSAAKFGPWRRGPLERDTVQA